jgi:hypothetical protein
MFLLRLIKATAKDTKEGSQKETLCKGGIRMIVTSKSSLILLIFLTQKQSKSQKLKQKKIVAV